MTTVGACPKCGAGALVIVKGNEPYTTDHLQCQVCDSTYAEAPVTNYRDIVREQLDDDLKALFDSGEQVPLLLALQQTRHLAVIEHRVTSLDQEGIATWEKRY